MDSAKLNPERSRLRAAKTNQLFLYITFVHICILTQHNKFDSTLTAHGVLEVYLKYATSMPSTRTWVSICILESYWNVPPPHTDFSVCSPARSKYASSILQVYLGRAREYTRAVLGEVRDKYILGEVYFRNYSPSTLQGVFAKYASRSLRQVRVKESSPSILQAYSIKYAPSTLTVVCIMLSYKSCID